MKNGTSIFVAAFLGLVVFAPLGACLPSADVGIGTGGTSGGGSSGNAGQTGSGGRAGGAGTGGSSANCSPGGATGASSEKANWASMLEVVGSCMGADCHADREPLLIGRTGPLSDAELYNKLTTLTSTKCGNRVLVKPCSPEESAFYLVQRPEACGPGSVAFRMPFGCVDNCTPANYLDGIRQWIANGAPRP